MPEIGEVYNCQGDLFEVTMVDPGNYQTAQAGGEWEDAVEFKHREQETAARFVLSVDAFLSSYFPVDDDDEEQLEHPPEGEQF
jgi:hypothetical protein